MHRTRLRGVSAPGRYGHGHFRKCALQQKPWKPQGAQTARWAQLQTFGTCCLEAWPKRSRGNGGEMRPSRGFLAAFSEPIVAFTDRFVGETHGMRVDVSDIQGNSATAVQVRSTLSLLSACRTCMMCASHACTSRCTGPLSSCSACAQAQVPCGEEFL